MRVEEAFACVEEEDAVVDDGEVVDIGTMAERQDGVLTVAQAVRCGLSLGQIARRRAGGVFRRTRRGVVQIAGVPPSWRRSVRTACMAAGQEVALSHASAVRLYGVELPPAVHPRWARDSSRIEVAAPLPRHVRLAGVRGHRSGAWEPGDVVRHAGMLVTSPVRTVIDLSSRLGVEGTGKLVDELIRRGLLRIEELRERIASLRPAPGRSMRVLRIVVAVRGDDDPGESTLEARIRRVIRRTGFPAPVGQHWVSDGQTRVRLDFAYPDVKLYIEGDGFGFHRLPSDLDGDVRKRNLLLREGWVGLHFTARMTDAEIERNLAAVYDRATSTWRLPR
jgi:very-short-patch-repair endonuclease